MNQSRRSSARESRPLRFATAGLLLISLLPLAGCAKRAHFETSGGGHAISVDVEGAPVIDSRAGQAVISSQFGGVTIERDRARIDQGQWTRIPDNVPVETSISKHTVSVRAGRVSLSRTVR